MKKIINNMVRRGKKREPKNFRAVFLLWHGITDKAIEYLNNPDETIIKRRKNTRGVFEKYWGTIETIW